MLATPRLRGLLLLALALACLGGRHAVEARWGRGGATGKQKREAGDMLDEALKEELVSQGVEDVDDIDENLLMKRMRKMRRDASVEAARAKRVSAQERAKDYKRSGRLVRDIAAGLLLFVVLLAVYGFREEIFGIKGPKKKRN